MLVEVETQFITVHKDSEFDLFDFGHDVGVQLLILEEMVLELDGRRLGT